MSGLKLAIFFLAKIPTIKLKDQKGELNISTVWRGVFIKFGNLLL